MIPIKQIREHKDVLVKALSKRGIEAEPILSEVLHLDQQKRTLQVRFDETQHKLNTLSSKIGSLMQEGAKDEAEKLKEETAELKLMAKSFGPQIDTISEKLYELLSNLPNAPHESVPVGNDDSENEIIFSTEVPVPTGKLLPHWELAKKYDLIDFELGAKVTGAGFPVYKGKGVKLQRALINYFLDKNIAAGYTEYQPPYMVNEASAFGTGQLPDKDAQMYYVAKDNLYLIPTSEVPLTNFFRDTLLNASELPIKCTGYSPCFRREAGSYGAHVKGLNRLHQFDKVELMQVVHPDQSYNVLEEMIAHVDSILAELNLPYRKLRLCSGDLGFGSALTIDFEAFSIAQDRWLEISSVSNFEVFQANRMKLRIKDPAVNENILAHTLNGSSLALPRVMATLLEHYQDEKGIKMPEVLLPYTGFDYIS